MHMLSSYINHQHKLSWWLNTSLPTCSPCHKCAVMEAWLESSDDCNCKTDWSHDICRTKNHCKHMSSSTSLQILNRHINIVGGCLNTNIRFY